MQFLLIFVKPRRQKFPFSCYLWEILKYEDPTDICNSLSVRMKTAVKKPAWGTSLAVQWLRVCHFNARDTGLIPALGIQIPHVAWCGQHHHHHPPPKKKPQNKHKKPCFYYRTVPEQYAYRKAIKLPVLFCPSFQIHSPLLNLSSFLKGTKEPFDESKRGEWKSGLKPNIQKTKIMASGPITSWQVDGETVETAFIFLGSKITADGDCSHEIKTLAPWKKNYDQPRRILKNRDITLPTKVCIVKAMVFPVVM